MKTEIQSYQYEIQFNPDVFILVTLIPLQLKLIWFGPLIFKDVDVEPANELILLIDKKTSTPETFKHLEL